MSPSATPATWNEGGCHQVPRKQPRRHRRLKQAQALHHSLPRLPCKTKVHVTMQVPRLPRKSKVDLTKRHACHAKPRWMSPKMDVTKWHACHAKWCGVLTTKTATPATQSAAASPTTKTSPSAPPEPTQCHKCHATQNEGGCDQVPRLPRETKVDVAKCHACHAKCRGVTGD